MAAPRLSLTSCSAPPCPQHEDAAQLLHVPEHKDAALPPAPQTARGTGAGQLRPPIPFCNVAVKPQTVGCISCSREFVS